MSFTPLSSFLSHKWKASTQSTIPRRWSPGIDSTTMVGRRGRGRLWRHIITAVIGSGVLSLSWAIAQLGWLAGTVILVTFAIINYYTSTMLADCYRSPDAAPGTRNYTYMDVVRAYLGICLKDPLINLKILITMFSFFNLWNLYFLGFSFYIFFTNILYLWFSSFLSWRIKGPN